MRIAYAGVFLYRGFFLWFLDWWQAAEREREQTKLKSNIVTTHIQQLGTFYPAKPKHHDLVR